MDSPNRFSTTDSTREVVMSVHRIKPSLLMGRPWRWRRRGAGFFCMAAGRWVLRSVSGALPSAFMALCSVSNLLAAAMESRRACASRSSRSLRSFAAFFSAFAFFCAISRGHTSLAYSTRLTPHITAAGNSTASSRWAGRKKRRRLTNSAERNILRPLLSDVPAVRKKYTTVCHIFSSRPLFILRPDT